MFSSLCADGHFHCAALVTVPKSSPDAVGHFSDLIRHTKEPLDTVRVKTNTFPWLRAIYCHDSQNPCDMKFHPNARAQSPPTENHKLSVQYQAVARGQESTRETIDFPSTLVSLTQVSHGLEKM
jgi:hypothetical protein